MNLQKQKISNGVNNIIKNKQKISFLAKIVAIFFLFFGLVGVCAGQEPPPRLDVVFVPNPLFSAENFLPADVATGTVTVTNNSEKEQNILVEAINVTDDEGLGEELVLTISEGTNILYDKNDGTFGDFLRMGEISLSTLPVGGQTAYLFEVEFKEASVGPQGASIGFDICIGFEDENGVACGNTALGNEKDTEGGNDGGDNVIILGGGGVYFPSLTIRNERVTMIEPTDGTAIINWDTNLLSTSQVIYRLASSDYIFNLDNDEPPYYFGYPKGTVEDKIKVTSHSVLLTGLESGTYKYRVISRASPPTISYEHTFVVKAESSNEVGSLGLLSGETGQDIPPVGGESAGPGSGDENISGGVLGTKEESEEGLYSVGTEGSGKKLFGFLGDTADFFKNILSGGKITVNTDALSGKNIDRSGNLAATLFAFLENDLSAGKIIFILLLLILLFLIWRTTIKSLKNKAGI